MSGSFPLFNLLMTAGLVAFRCCRIHILGLFWLLGSVQPTGKEVERSGGLTPRSPAALRRHQLPVGAVS